MPITEKEIANHLIDNYKNVPLSSMKVYWHLGDWNVSGYMPIPVDNGIIEIDFVIDSCHTFFGFDEISDIEVKFSGNKSHTYRFLSKIQGIVDKEILKLKEYILSIKN